MDAPACTELELFVVSSPLVVVYPSSAKNISPVLCARAKQDSPEHPRRFCSQRHFLFIRNNALHFVRAGKAILAGQFFAKKTRKHDESLSFVIFYDPSECRCSSRCKFGFRDAVTERTSPFARSLRYSLISIAWHAAKTSHGHFL